MTVSATDVATAITGVVPPTGRLEPGRYLRLVVSDDGCGIDPASRDRLFDPFYTTKAPGAGTGLGLATAAEVMREAGGSIQIDPAAAAADVREGATFHLDFPLDASSRHAIG
jgi:signal transduction histidine kinase